METFIWPHNFHFEERKMLMSLLLLGSTSSVGKKALEGTPKEAFGRV
jgi:hypothetical protein